MIPHDERIALCNQLFRKQVVPALPKTEGACLMVFPVNNAGGAITYISNCERVSMREMLRKLLDKWDADEA